MPEAQFAEDLAKALHMTPEVDRKQFLRVKGFAADTLSVSRYSSNEPLKVNVDHTGEIRGHLLVVPMRTFTMHYLGNPEGRVESLLRPAGHAALSDLAFPFDGEAIVPFDNVCFVLPKTTFSDIRDMLELAEFHLPERCFRVEEDEILAGLAKTALPVLDRPWEANKLFADHLCALIGLHSVRRFGVLRARQISVGGLAPWQLARAKQMMLDDLASDPSLKDLASACGMSVGHFSRGFKISEGVPPHRWRLSKRIQRACELLDFSRLPLSEIATACGFADQSHMTRVFQKGVGASPGRYRSRAAN